MGSRSLHYRRSLRRHRRFLRSYRHPCRVVAILEAIGGRAVADAVTPIVARLAKHHKTLSNIGKYHATHVKHCDAL